MGVWGGILFESRKGYLSSVCLNHGKHGRRGRGGKYEEGYPSSVGGECPQAFIPLISTSQSRLSSLCLNHGTHGRGGKRGKYEDAYCLSGAVYKYTCMHVYTQKDGRHGGACLLPYKKTRKGYPFSVGGELPVATVFFLSESRNARKGRKKRKIQRRIQLFCRRELRFPTSFFV